MKKHGTPLMPGPAANFIGALAKSAVLVASALDPTVLRLWERKQEILQAALLETLSNTADVFLRWRTVRLSNWNYEEYVEHLDKAGMFLASDLKAVLTDLAVIMQDDPRISELGEYDITAPTVGDLGFEEANYSAICRRGTEFGLHLCPKRLGVELRLAYEDQPEGETLFLAIEGSPHDNYLLTNEHKRLWLLGNSRPYGSPLNAYQKSDRFVFVKARR